MNNLKKKGALFKSVACGYIILGMIFAHTEIGNEIREALKLWAGVLIPSLFPYLVLAQYVTASDVMDFFNPLKKAVHKILNISESGANVYLCSLISGYPTGAVCSAGLYKDRIIKKEEAERLVCFTNNAGPLFVISVVGADMLGSSGDGLALYVIQSVSAMLAGIVLGIKAPKTPYRSVRCKNRGMSLDKCTQNAINTMLAIGAFLVLACVVARIAIISFKMVPVYGKKLSPYAKIFVYCILEITGAMKALSEFGNTRLVFSVISSVLSWSGICVLMQIKNVIPDEFSLSKIVGCKIVQSSVSFLLAFTYKSFFVLKMSFKTDIVFTASIIMSVIIFSLFILKSKRESYKNT